MLPIFVMGGHCQCVYLALFMGCVPYIYYLYATDSKIMLKYIHFSGNKLAQGNKLVQKYRLVGASHMRKKQNLKMDFKVEPAGLRILIY